MSKRTRAGLRTTPQRFTDVLRAEALRLTTLNKPVVLVIVALIIATVFAALAAGLGQAVAAMGGMYEREGTGMLSRAAVSGATVLALLVGAIAIDITGAERASGARHLTNLGTPRRGRTYLARLCVLVCGGAVVGLVALTICTLVVVGISAASGATAPFASAGLSLSRAAGMLLTMALVVGLAHGVVWLVPHTLAAIGIVVTIVWVAPIVFRALGGAEPGHAMHTVLRALPAEHLGALTAGEGTWVAVVVAGAWTFAA
ncbi:hypothetical protein, partial [Microbacterium sp.]|uniref:hypothetical protein n=1 Tax=Microbacterium sp. TaxID=51671 RepID=UPI0026263471